MCWILSPNTCRKTSYALFSTFGLLGGIAGGSTGSFIELHSEPPQYGLAALSGTAGLLWSIGAIYAMWKIRKESFKINQEAVKEGLQCAKEYVAEKMNYKITRQEIKKRMEESDRSLKQVYKKVANDLNIHMENLTTSLINDAKSIQKSAHDVKTQLHNNANSFHKKNFVSNNSEHHTDPNPQYSPQ